MTRKSGEKLSFMRLSAVAILTAGLVLAFGCTARTTVAAPKTAEEKETLYTIDITNHTCTLNGEPTDLASIAALLEATADSLKVSGNISISADDDTPYGRILEIKNLLRTNKFFKINYISSNGTTISRIMPPLPEHSSDNVQILPTEDMVPYSNLYISIVGEEGAAQYKTNHQRLLSEARKNSGSGVMFWMVAPNSNQKHIEDITEAHKLWMKREMKEMNDADRRYVVLPDGESRAAAYPRTSISLIIDNEAPYRSLTAVNNALYNLYAELREEKAKEIFHKSLAELNNEELACIYKIVPMAILEVDAATYYKTTASTNTAAGVKNNQ